MMLEMEEVPSLSTPHNKAKHCPSALEFKDDNLTQSTPESDFSISNSPPRSRRRTSDDLDPNNKSLFTEEDSFDRRRSSRRSISPGSRRPARKMSSLSKFSFAVLAISGLAFVFYASTSVRTVKRGRSRFLGEEGVINAISNVAHDDLHLVSSNDYNSSSTSSSTTKITATASDHDSNWTSLLQPSSVKEFINWYPELFRLAELNYLPEDYSPKVNWAWHPKERSKRFPSVQERIRYYMGEWYNTSMPMYGYDFQRRVYPYQRTTRRFGTSATLAVNLFNNDRYQLYQCCQFEKFVVRTYCRDFIDFAILSEGLTANALQHIGDAFPEQSRHRALIEDLPIFNKVRYYCREDDPNGVNGPLCSESRLSGIIWPLNRKRHFGPPALVPEADVPWEEKVGKVIWRGGTNDPLHTQMKWELVSKHVKSKLVDAKFALRQRDGGSLKRDDKLPEEYTGPFITFEEQLQSKYLISLEGNDVSSGLKWMLFSNSLVFMPPITYEGWAMEGLLEPFVHYVPIKRDMSDLEEKVTWAENHPIEAQKIVERATLFIYDMLFHPDAVRDEQLILQGIMEKYEENFGYLSAVRKHHPLTHIHKDWHPSKREYRFPSVDWRVKYYMGDWHGKTEPSMERTDENMKRLAAFDKQNPIAFDEDFLARAKLLKDCYEQKKDYPKEILANCIDASTFFDHKARAELKSDIHPDLDKSMKLVVDSESSEDASDEKKWFKRVLLDDSLKLIRFGDSITEQKNEPVFAKTRKANLDKPGKGGNGILWQFDYATDYSLVQSGIVEKLDIPFKDKKPKAVWRGGLGAVSSTQMKDNPEHRLRYSHLIKASNFTKPDLIDAKFVLKKEVIKKLELSESQATAEPTKESEWQENLRHMLSHRYIVATEDRHRANSDLKWMLLSQSVVFMRREQQFTTWFMEDTLEPYVHYVPIGGEYNNVEEKIQWCEDNSRECERISERATLFVHDMLFHESSQADNAEIQHRIMETYAEQFGG